MMSFFNTTSSSNSLFNPRRLISSTPDELKTLNKLLIENIQKRDLTEENHSETYKISSKSESIWSLLDSCEYISINSRFPSESIQAKISRKKCVKNVTVRTF